MSVSSPQYWRDRKKWSTWIGRRGTVIGGTLIHVGSPQLQENTPYPYVIVDFGDERRAFVGTGNEPLIPGDEVICVWRKMGTVSEESVIRYGIKVQRIPQLHSNEGVLEPETEPEIEEVSAEEQHVQNHR